MTERVWRHQVTGVDGLVNLWGENIFALKWCRTGETAVVLDPLYGQEFRFPVYRVKIRGEERIFAAGEFSNCVWGFYTPVES